MFSLQISLAGSGKSKEGLFRGGGLFGHCDKGRVGHDGGKEHQEDFVATDF